MAQVIVGDPNVFNAMAYSAPCIESLEFMNRINDFEFSKLTDAGRNWIDNTKDVFKNVYNNSTRAISRVIKKLYNSYWSDFDIRELFLKEDFQSANLTNQRWIMANPIIGQMVVKGTVNGYSNTYVNIHAGKYGVDNYDWRRVMDGYVTETELGGWESVNYIDDLNGEHYLELDEQRDIIRSWERFIHMVDVDNIDPSSIYDDPPK